MTAFTRVLPLMATLVALPSMVQQSGPVFREASVHDPSILRAGETYYVFGSHLAAAKTKDFLAWDMVAAGVNEQNPLFSNVREELKETFEWAETRTLWAPDVVRLKNGKYAMYYCGCKGDSPRSALGLALADKPEGPYKDQGILLKSGMWGQPSEDGKVYDPRIHPNAIDPNTFYDPAGKLWMVYGSYSGGIFILQMDPNTGKPFPGQGYGKHLTGGNHARIEGAYILYSPKTKYYYMFLSFGGLDSRGGYNMRVARSRQPDGPYVDAGGKQMSLAKSDPTKPLFDDRTIEPYGTKIMGNFQFGSGFGYVSPGHNSAYVDPKTGKHLLIFHARFPGQGEGHQVRVHEMHMTSSGWPVVAPQRYSGREESKVVAADAIGDFEVIKHGQALTNEIVKPFPLRFEKGGKVSGSQSGKWELKGNHLRLTLDGVSYEGAFLKQWSAEAKAKVPAFTLLSSKGLTLWGIRRAS